MCTNICWPASIDSAIVVAIVATIDRCYILSVASIAASISDLGVSFISFGVVLCYFSNKRTLHTYIRFDVAGMGRRCRLQRTRYWANGGFGGRGLY